MFFRRCSHSQYALFIKREEDERREEEREMFGKCGLSGDLLLHRLGSFETDQTQIKRRFEAR